MGVYHEGISLKDKDLNSYLSKPKRLERFLRSERRRKKHDEFSLDKLWDGILFLLTGKSSINTKIGEEILSYAVLGAKVFNHPKLNYGEVYPISSNDVKLLYEKLKDINCKDLLAKFSGELFNENEVYPNGLWDSSVDILEELEFYINKMLTFYKSAYDKGFAVINIYG